MTIMINANDEPNGVLSLKSDDGNSLPLVRVNEGGWSQIPIKVI